MFPRNIHGIDGFDPQVFPTPDFSHASTDGQRHEWINGSLETNDFPTMPVMTGLPTVNDGDAFPEFLTLPNEDDWSRWHNGPDVTTDLDGLSFPPRGRYTVSSFASPPMGGIIND